MDPDVSHRPSSDILSINHIDLVRRWRKECNLRHTACGKLTAQILPTRVLEIGATRGQLQRVRLIETHGVLEGHYACLSYCWGSDIAVGKTTSSNLLRYTSLGIPLEELPKTIIDAISVCASLGLNYLWVDRLCIIQDDDGDWMREASQMCDIYTRSALTISTPICQDASESFRQKRQENPIWRPEERKPVTHIHPANDQGQKSLTYFHPQRPNSQGGAWFLDNSWSSFASSQSPANDAWIRRGWTLQEWLLSRRVLHIHEMTSWDCLEGYANEINHRYMVSAKLARDPDRWQTPGTQWKDTVMEFSRRRLTKDSDKLPALAGLAARYARSSGFTYLAGLWAEDLPIGLLWSVNMPVDGQGPSERSSEYRAPSWSWASTNESVRFLSRFEQEEEVLTSVHDTFIEPENSFSACSKCWLDLVGPRVKVCRIVKTSSWGAKLYCGEHPVWRRTNLDGFWDDAWEDARDGAWEAQFDKKYFDNEGVDYDFVGKED